ncbi:MAG: DUF3187 family protein [Deltaproteobacteria bacterium]|nr:DUF3187 family protein [Deltaproteobacteria bacterium]
MKKILLLASLFLFLFSQPLRSEEQKGFGPLTVQTQNPLLELFLQAPSETPHTLGSGHFRFEIQETLSNIFERENAANGSTNDLDMELYKTAFSFSYGLGKRYELGIKLPFLSFSGGFLDAFIQNYHNTFGFPNAGREEVPNGRFNYSVKIPSGTYAPKKTDFGLSNIELYFKTRILDEEKWAPALSLRATLKVPTGKKSEGLGSGNPDFHFNLALEKSYKIFHSYTNLGFLFLGGMEELNSNLHRSIFSFSQSFEVQFCSVASVLAQIQGSSPYFKDTGLASLDEIPLDLVIGFKGKGNDKGPWEHFRWELAFAEDLVPSGPSVDFSLHFNLGAEF